MKLARATVTRIRPLMSPTDCLGNGQRHGHGNSAFSPLSIPLRQVTPWDHFPTQLHLFHPAQLLTPSVGVCSENIKTCFRFSLSNTIRKVTHVWISSVFFLVFSYLPKPSMNELEWASLRSPLTVRGNWVWQYYTHSPHQCSGPILRSSAVVQLRHT